MYQTLIKSSLFSLLLLLATNLLYAQNNHEQVGEYLITGSVTNLSTHLALVGANLSLSVPSSATHSDQNGNYKFSVKQGIYHLKCDFIGYIPLDTLVQVNSNVVLNLSLTISQQNLKEVKVKGTGSPKEIATQSLSILEGEQLDHTRGFSLGESLKSITGVTTFQTGPSIAKPIIHGLYSNRILILNNGVRLEAQQWGSEHAPEIDPFIANRLEVIKGAASIRYGSDAIGGVILAEPKALPKNPGMDGEINAIGMSNSRLGAFSGMLEGAFDKKLTGLSYRLQGTFKIAGNSSTPNYLLANTGLREQDGSAAVQYHHKNYGFEAYYSVFNTKLGIFQGAEVGSIADLKLAIEQTEPLTPSFFTYAIDRPYQTVNHQTLKLNSFYNFENGSKLRFQFANQTNTREEYDFLPLNGRINPELYLKINTQTADINYEHKDLGNFSGSFGFNGITQGNIRKYEYLIPNYRNYGGGAYFIEKYTHGNLLLEAGLRYDYRWLRAYKLNNNTALIETPTTHYQSASYTIGTTYSITDALKLSGNYSSAFRAPTVNELYSNGIHQSLVSYEIGNPDLHTERANNFNINLDYTTSRLLINVQAYYNSINNFIFANPTNQYTRTVRGPALVFNYTQADVYFRGLDFNLILKPVDSLELNSKTSLIYAYNKTIHDYLIYTPPSRFQNSIGYHFGNLSGLKRIFFSVEDVYVSKQSRVPVGQDYVLPPAGYNLINLQLSFRVNYLHNYADVSFAVNNLTNTAYRDYLDRFRYFTDEPGRNFIVRLKVPFKISKTTHTNR